MNLFGTTKPADAGTPGASSVVAAPAVVDPMDSVSSTMNIPAVPTTPPPAPAPVMPDPIAVSPAPATPMPDLSSLTNAMPPAPTESVSPTPVVPSVPEVAATPTPAPVIEPTPVQETPAPTPAAEMPVPEAPADELSEEDKESILDKTLRRVAEVMTEEDMREFERIDREDTSGNAGKYFLMTRVPHFEDILQEELSYAQHQHALNQSTK